MLRRLLPLLLVLLVSAGDARASCVWPDPRTQIQRAPAAFVGHFESERREGTGERWLRFRVERALKSDLGETVEIHEPGMSSVSFGAFSPGEPVGLMLYLEDGAWQSNSCLRYDPRELADALEPLARPPGRGRAAFLAGGHFGDASLIALDARGRTLAYGFGGGRLAAVCPGGRRFLALGDRQLLVGRTRDLRTIGRRTVPWASSAHCSRDGLYVAGASGIFRGARRIWRGAATRAAFHGRRAFVLGDRTLLSVDLRSGRARTLARFTLPAQHEPLSALAVSPRGTRVAVLAANAPVQGGEPPSRIAVYDTRARRLRIADLPGHVDGTLVWTAEDRFAVLPWRGVGGDRMTLIFDARLRPRDQVAGWTAIAPVGFGGAIVGIAGHRLERATAGGASELGRLPGSEVFDLHRVPGVPVRASRRVPRY